MRTMSTSHASATPKFIFLSDKPLKGECPSNKDEMDSLIIRISPHEWHRLTGAAISGHATVHVIVETDDD